MTADISDLVVEILHYRSDDKNPYWSVGSGFFVGESLVLTALHNVDGRGELLVRIRGKEEHPATVILPTDKDHKDMDLAVLKISDVAVDVPPLRYGTVDRSAPAEVERCWAIGFPEFKVLEHGHGKPKPPPTTVQIKGKIPTCECLGQQRLTLHAEINPRPSSEGSEWAGMSGAVVFAGNDIVVGVITEHHLPEGESALNVVPITAIDNLLPSTEAAKWWRLLGVDRQALVSLPDMNGSIRHENSWSYIKDFRPIIDPKKIFGREKELQDIENLLKNKSSIVIKGFRGTGKSTLASMFVDRMKESGKFVGIYWRRVDETTDITDIIDSFFTAIGKPVKNLEHYKISDQINLLFHELNELAYLLVLDNFEILINSQTNKPLESKIGFSDLIEITKDNCIRSKILFTSWDSFANERGFRPFSYPVRGLDTSSGISLLKREGLTEPETELKKAVEISGGHPLALILLAQLVIEGADTLSILLNADSLWIGEYGDVAENILNKVYNERLSDDERIFLQFVSIFRQPVPAQAICAIANGSEWPESKVKKIGLSLTHKSLLQKDGEKYWEESLISKYAGNKLSEKSKLHRLAYKYFFSIPLPPKPAKKEDLQLIIEAHYHACEAGEYDLAADIIWESNLSDLLDLWGYQKTLIEIYVKLLPKDHFKGEPILKDKWIHGAVLGNLENAYRDLGEPKKAIEYGEQALKNSRGMDDRRGEGNWLGNLGLAYRDLGEPKKAIKYTKHALKIAKEISDRRREGIHLGNLGVAYMDLGEPKKAIKYTKHALKIAKEISDRRREGIHLGNLGLAHRYLGEPKKTIEYSEQSLKIAKEIGDRRGEGNSLSNLGLAYMDLGEPKKTIEYSEQSLKIAREIGNRRGEGYQLSNLGLAYMDLGEPKKTIKYSEQSLKIAREIGNKRGEGHQFENMGLAFRDLGEHKRAIEHSEQALKIAREIGNRRSEGIRLGNLGVAYMDLGETKKAIEYNEQALIIAREIGDRRNEGAWLGNLGLAYHDLGETQKAIEYMGQALIIAREIGDRHNEGAWLGNLGLAYRNLGKTEKAIEFLKKSLAIGKSIEDPRIIKLFEQKLKELERFNE
jgi:tetratricopeptide (TPR) repeat protein